MSELGFNRVSTGFYETVVEGKNPKAFAGTINGLRARRVYVATVEADGMAPTTSPEHATVKAAKEWLAAAYRLTYPGEPVKGDAPAHPGTRRASSARDILAGNADALVVLEPSPRAHGVYLTPSENYGGVGFGASVVTMTRERGEPPAWQVNRRVRGVFTAGDVVNDLTDARRLIDADYRRLLKD